MIKIGLFFLGFCLSSCSSTQQKKITLTTPIAQDTKYAQILTDRSAEVSVYNNFKTVYTVRASYMDRTMMEALAQRHQDIFSEGVHLLLPEGKIGFFISLYTPNRENNYLSDKDLWNVLLKMSNQTLTPSSIKRLEHKHKWDSFFEGLSAWSREYLVVFDHDHSGDATIPVELILASPKAKATLRF